MRWLIAVVCVAGLGVVGCATQKEKKRRQIKGYKEILLLWERLPEIARAIEHRRAGHNWRAVAYSSHKFNEQREALRNAIEEFREAVNWYILAKKNHPSYRDFIEKEIDAIYKYILLCHQEMPEGKPEAALSRWEKEELEVQLKRMQLAEEMESWGSGRR